MPIRPLLLVLPRTKVVDAASVLRALLNCPPLLLLLSTQFVTALLFDLAILFDSLFRDPSLLVLALLTFKLSLLSRLILPSCFELSLLLLLLLLLRIPPWLPLYSLSGRLHLARLLPLNITLLPAAGPFLLLLLLFFLSFTAATPLCLRVIHAEKHAYRESGNAQNLFKTSSFHCSPCEDINYPNGY